MLMTHPAALLRDTYALLAENQPAPADVLPGLSEVPPSNFLARAILRHGSALQMKCYLFLRGGGAP